MRNAGSGVRDGGVQRCEHAFEDSTCFGGRERLPARADAGVGQQVLDETLHPRCAVDQIRDELLGGRVELVAIAPLQQLRVAPDHPQRLLEIVRRDVGEALELFVRAVQLLLDATALGVGATERGRVPQDRSDEDHDDRHRIRSRAERRGVHAHALARQPEPSEREGQPERQRQEAARHRAPRGVSDEDRDHPAIGAGAQHPERHGGEAQGGMEGDGAERVHGVQRSHIVRVSYERGEGHERHDERQDLGRRPGPPAIQRQERRAGACEAQRRHLRHPLGVARAQRWMRFSE